MILICVCDGLRPDIVNVKRMPFVSSLRRDGAWCTNSHCVFPSATRINSASLATGCYPAHHGIVDNELYVPEIDRTEAVSCADWRNLRRTAQIEGGRLLTVPTVGERLAGAGHSMASGGSGSPGTTYLTNPETTGPVANWAVAWPEQFQAQLISALGGMVNEESSSSERNRFVVDALKELVISQNPPDLLTVWFTEPDHMQHAHGIGSPEADSALCEVDSLVQELVAFSQSQVGGDLTVFVTSDHGFHTISEVHDPRHALTRAGWVLDGPSPEIIKTSNSLHLEGRARRDVSELVEWLAAEPWVGGIMVRDDLLPECPQAVPQSATRNLHSRSAEVMLSYRWSDEANAFGIPGSVVHGAPIAAIHGSASPYAMNNTLLAWGAGIRRDLVSEASCGIVDLAPTVCYLMGIPASGVMDGRVLSELLEDGTGDLRGRVASESWVYGRGTQSHQQTVRYSYCGDHVYLDRIDWQ